MGVSSYFEFVTTLFAWVMYDNLWQVLNDSGIVYLPILAMILGHIIDSRKGGDDEGSAPIQSLKKIETDFAVMVVVIVLAAIPIVDIKLGEMQYKRPPLNCSVPATTVTGGAATGTTLDHTLTTFGGEVGRSPLWWAFLHIVSKAVTSASIAAIPCSYDIASMTIKLSNNKIKDPNVAREVHEFYEACYAPASSKFMSEASGTISDADRAKMTWIGSPYFLRTPGYYDHFYSHKARDDWAFDPVRDKGYEGDETPSGNGGHPTCKQWWESSGVGLRSKLMASIDPSLVSEFTGSTGLIARKARFSGTTLSSSELNDQFLREYLAVNSASGSAIVPGNYAMSYHVSTGEAIDGRIAAVSDSSRSLLDRGVDAVSGYLGVGKDIARDIVAKTSIGIGGLITAPAALAEGEMIRKSVSIFQSIILLMMVVLLPFLLIVSRYKLSTVMTLSVIMFGLHFLSFIWAIAFWADNNLLAALASNGGPTGIFAVASNPIQAFATIWMSRFFYVYFPMLFMIMMGWAGYNFGTLGNVVQTQAGNTTTPATAGGTAISKVATGKVTK